MKTGFKATYNFLCKDHKFEIGKTYELEGTPVPCHYGFHYCQNPVNVLEYYPLQHDFRLLEIEDLGDSIVEQDKTVTNKIRIVREIPKEEYHPLFGIINNESKITYENGSWEKRKYDENHNCIYFENSNGYWKKHSYDERNNCIYSEYSTGFWKKYEYDERNNQIYFEDSSSCFWEKRTFDERNNLIYYKDSTGFWKKYEYDERNNQIYYEDSNGTYYKREYDERNNLIYYENQNGFWIKRKYDQNNNCVYIKDSDDFFQTPKFIEKLIKFVSNLISNCKGKS